MKKTLMVLAIFAFASSTLLAQQKKTTSVSTSSNDDKLHSYLGLGSGVNNISGFFGLTFEQPFSKNIAAKTAIGVGSWGYKFALSGRFYRDYAKSWAFGAGYSTASGLGDFSTNLETTASGSGSTELVRLKLGRAHMIDLTASRGWGNKVKFNLELGYSIAISGGTYVVLDNNKTLSETATRVMNLLSPGGLILGLGVSFRL